MTPEYKKNEKILSLLVIILLFLCVGFLFFLISRDSKIKNEILNKEAQRLRKERVEMEKLANIQLNTASTTGLTSKSFLTVALNSLGGQKILAEKNPDLPRPIASLTKLMLAIIVLENIALETEITASTDYIGLEESAFVLETGRKYTARELLANALISSDNDSARLLSSSLGETVFVGKMNRKAEELGMVQTNFANVTGLDPKDDREQGNINTSSATDMVKLLIHIKKEKPEIFRLTTRAKHDFCDTNGYCKSISNTNKLLENAEFKFRIIGGKTGSTDLAGKNLALLAQSPDGFTVISVVLGAKDNFNDTLNIFNSLK